MFSSPTLWLSVRFLVLVALCCIGCRSQEQQRTTLQTTVGQVEPAALLSNPVDLVDYQEPESGSNRLPAVETPVPDPPLAAEDEPDETLRELEAWALANNPVLRRMRHETAALWARTGYVDKLPDPTVGAMAFIPPMHYDPDRQLAELQFMQMIPWLGRLEAEAQRACFEAMVAENEYRAERLRVLGDVRAAWYRLYVLSRQIEITRADQGQLESLLKTANARVATGDAQPGDVLMASLELSSLEEQLLTYRQQVAATSAELNRLLGRNAATRVALPKEIDPRLPAWSHEFLWEVALQTQPELNAARLRTAATRWGIEVARLKRRPDLTFGVGWMVMDAPGAAMPDAGGDNWTVGVTASIPIWHRKYDAMVSEASREHFAAHASEDEVAQRLDALLRELWEEALAAQRTVELYETSILPQARQTFEADQKSLVNNTVTFERVIADYRTLLKLELGYHRALTQLATSLARIRQAVGTDLEVPVAP